nr:hypothetical protein GCM10020093_094910 [Planobispora longispora]
MSEPMMIRVRAGAPVKDVHHALTDPAAMRVWLDEHAEVDLPHRYAFWGRHTPPATRPASACSTPTSARCASCGRSTTPTPPWRSGSGSWSRTRPS